MVKEEKNIKNNVYESIIVGGGPAGLTAGLYLSRYRVNTLLIEKGISGGQVNLSETIENYPGFPEGIIGPELMQRFEEQATKFGLKIVNSTVLEISQEQHENKTNFKISTTDRGFYSKSVILA